MARISSNLSAKHKSRNSLTYISGRERLRTKSLKQLQEKLQSAQSGRLKDAIRKEIARRTKLGIVWHQPVEETVEE
jgi:hypothetical protein